MASCLCHTAAVLFFIIWTLTLPLTLVLLLPIYLYRVIVQQLSKLKKDLGKMVNVRDSLFAREYPDMFKSVSRSSLSVTLIIDGTIQLEELYDVFLNQIANLKSSNNDYVYPELRQTLTRWGGYIFWRWDKNFNIKNHVNLYEGPGQKDLVSEKDMHAIMKELSCRPFKRDQSPWEVWLWNNARYTTDKDGRIKSIIVFRIFHCMADGYSVMKLLVEDFASVKNLTSVVQFRKTRGKKPNLMNLICKTICMPIKLPFQLISTVIESLDFNSWHLPQSQLTGILCNGNTDKFPVGHVKDIKNMYSTAFQTVLLAAFTGGLRNYMIEKGLKVPKSIHCQIPLPFSTHPTHKLGNHLTLAFIELPIGLSGPADRIRFLDQNLKKIGKSTVSMSLFYLIPFMGALPHRLLKILPINNIVTCIMSNFPGPFKQVHFRGQIIDDVIFGGGLLVGSIGIGAASLTYNGECRLSLGVDTTIISQAEDIQNILVKMRQEIYLLREQEIV